MSTSEFVLVLTAIAGVGFVVGLVVSGFVLGDYVDELDREWEEIDRASVRYCRGRCECGRRVPGRKDLVFPSGDLRGVRLEG